MMVMNMVGRGEASPVRKEELVPKSIKKGIFEDPEIGFPKKVPAGLLVRCKNCSAEYLTEDGEKLIPCRGGSRRLRASGLFLIGWKFKCECGCWVFIPWPKINEGTARENWDLMKKINNRGKFPCGETAN